MAIPEQIPVIPEGTDPPLSYTVPPGIWTTLGRVGDTAIKVIADTVAGVITLAIHATDLTAPVRTDLLYRVQQAEGNAEYDQLVEQLIQFDHDQLRRLAVAVHDADYLIDMALDRKAGQPSAEDGPVYAALVQRAVDNGQVYPMTTDVAPGGPIRSADYDNVLREDSDA